MGDSSKDNLPEDSPSVIEPPIRDFPKDDPPEDGPSVIELPISASSKDDSPVIELSISETRIDVEQLYDPWGRPPPRDPRAPPPYSENPQQQQQQYYYSQHPSYYQQAPPPQQVGGQNIYYAGGTAQQPIDARRVPAYRPNYPPPPDEPQYQRNSEIFSSGFDTIKIRNRFVQRVYTILSVQLGFTFGVLLFCTFEENTRNCIRRWGLCVMIIGLVGFFCVYMALACVESLRRNYPTNFVLLGVLTIFMTMLMSAMVTIVPPMIVVLAMGTTALICVAVSIFAWQTKWDVTGCGCCFMILTAVLCIFGLLLAILACFGIYIKLLHMIYSLMGVMVFSCWLMYDTQMIVGGRRIELSPEEYILGAVQLYVDIMQIFMHLLTLYHLCMGE